MPSISFMWMKKYIKNLNHTEFPIFVETGTYQGNTVLALEKNFSKLHTIEIKKDLYLSVKNKYERARNIHNRKINFHLGDSGIILKHICPQLDANTIFFLDGHWSCGITGKGVKDCPLYEELTCILNDMAHECVIIIDDCRLFGKGPNVDNYECDWEDINISNIVNIVRPRLLSHHFAPSELDEKDRLILYLKKGVVKSNMKSNINPNSNQRFKMFTYK